MESTFATSSRFRFRDHQEAENATESDYSSDVSSASTENDDDDDDNELQSMTGKGIKRLCMELVEIKAVSDEDFYSNISASYSAFIGIVEEAKDMEKELITLKGHISTHKRLVKELVDGIYLEPVLDEMKESVVDESEFDEPNELEAHIGSVSDTLDVLLSENKIDEATEILLVEEQNLQKLQLDENISPYLLMLYNSVISERKTMILLQLTLVAETSRTVGPELQKALAGLCRLGYSHNATEFLLRYYHSRLATGIHNLQNSKLFLGIVYVKELSRFVFSMISQAAKSFTMLVGKPTAYTEQFMKWLEEEIEVFVVSFTKYVKSTSEISNGLSTAVEAVQFAMSYCSLLESQGLVLQPSLIEHIRPCMKKVLKIHMDHFKKVISIFTATDTWVLGRYLVSGIMSESYSSEVLGQQPEYCLLTNSGRKFVTLMQAITKDTIPMIALEMDDFIIRGLVDLFLEYTTILERALGSGTNKSDRNDSRFIFTESLQQQVSILANISTLEYFFSITILSIFGDTDPANSESQKNHSAAVQQQELDSIVLFIQETSGRLRDHFYQQFIFRAVSFETGSKLSLEAHFDDENNHSMLPSIALQVLLLELRKLDRLIEDSIFRPDWLMELLRELVEAIFLWASNNETWETNEESQKFQHSDIINQFVLDMYFLMEITKCGEYFIDDPTIPASLMKTAFNAVGLDPKRDAKTDEWAIAAASEALQRLLRIEETESPEIQSEHASEAANDDDRTSSDDSPTSKEDALATDTSEVSADKKRLLPDSESSLLENEDCSVETAATHQTYISGELENMEYEIAADDVGEASEVHLTGDDEAQSGNNETEILDKKIKDERDAELFKSLTTLTKDPTGL